MFLSYIWVDFDIGIERKIVLSINQSFFIIYNSFIIIFVVENFPSNHWELCFIATPEAKLFQSEL